MLSAIASTPSPLISLVRLIAPDALVPSKTDHALTPEDREEVFARLCILAHRKGFHVAPGVAIAGVLRVRDGRGTTMSGAGAKRAIGQERVDALVLDRTAMPLLALNLAHADRNTRVGRKRLQQKARLFQRAGLPLYHLGGTEDWDRDQPVVEALLSDLRPPRFR